MDNEDVTRILLVRATTEIHRLVPAVRWERMSGFGVLRCHIPA